MHIQRYSEMFYVELKRVHNLADIGMHGTMFNRAIIYHSTE